MNGEAALNRLAARARERSENRETTPNLPLHLVYFCVADLSTLSHQQRRPAGWLAAVWASGY